MVFTSPPASPVFNWDRSSFIPRPHDTTRGPIFLQSNDSRCSSLIAWFCKMSCKSRLCWQVRTQDYFCIICPTLGCPLLRFCASLNLCYPCRASSPVFVVPKWQIFFVFLCALKSALHVPAVILILLCVSPPDRSLSLRSWETLQPLPLSTGGNGLSA
jgi:hypothetical protein